jgi:CHAT domain-containing protein
MSTEDKAELWDIMLGLPIETPEQRLEVSALAQELDSPALTTLADELYKAAVAARGERISIRSLHIATLIVELGTQHQLPAVEALGMMLIGDYHNICDANYHRALKFLEGAGAMFRDHAHSEFGWARTRIGMLLCAIEFGSLQVHRSLQQAHEAEQIFLESTDPTALTRLVALYLNTGILHMRLGQIKESLARFNEVKRLASQFPPRQRMNFLSRSDHNIGVLYGQCGEARRASYFFMRAYIRRKWEGDYQQQWLALQNLARSEQAQGRYRQALVWLDEITDQMEATQVAIEDNHIYRNTLLSKVECYLELNDPRQAEAIGTHVQALIKLATPDQYDHALVYTLLASSNAQLGNYEASISLLDEALQIYTRLELVLPMAIVRLRQAQIALRQGDTQAAYTLAYSTIPEFEALGAALELAETLLVCVRAKWIQSEHVDADSLQQYTAEAFELAQRALTIAQTCGVMAPQFEAMTLLGHLYYRHQSIQQAEDYYRRALEIIDLLQRNLSILLRPGFLGDKGEALRGLVMLLLEQEDYPNTFIAVEQSRMQVFEAYLLERDTLDWAAISTTLRQPELGSRINQLRSDLRSYETRAMAVHPLASQPTPTPRLQVTAEARRRRQIAADTRRVSRELMQLVPQIMGSRQPLSKATTDDGNVPPSLPNQLREHLAPDHCLIEYYSDGITLHAFILTRDQLRHHALVPLDLVMTAIGGLQEAIELALDALKFVREDATAVSDLDILRHEALCDKKLNRVFQRSAGKIYDLLLRPIQGYFAACSRLIIVPYGVLHTIPFHLLYRAPDVASQTGTYLIREREILLLPTASLLLREPIATQRHAAHVVYDDWQGNLKHVYREANYVHQMFGGTLQDARQGALDTLLPSEPCAVLHIYGHGEFDLLRPAQSFIQLGDNRVMYPDFIRYPLHYELVVLTSCEIGKLSMVEHHLAMGDDQVGISRAFLHAGAGSLLMSQWLIGDGLTQTFFYYFYRFLQRGCSRAAAYRYAQLLLARRVTQDGDKELNPVFWGVFQLIGDGDAFSRFR